MPFTCLCTITLSLMIGYAARASKTSCNDDLVSLRNGAQVQGRMVSTIAFGIEQLAKTTPDVYQELVAGARDPDQHFSPGARAKLDAMGLLAANGHLDADVRNVTLSSARGRGPKVGYVSPIAPVEMTDVDLEIYFERTEDFARDIITLGDEHGVRLDVGLGEGQIAETERIAPNGALVLRVDADGAPRHFVTPQGGRHAFVFDPPVDAATRAELARNMIARFGLKPLAGRTDLLAVTKDVHAMPLPDPVLEP